MKKYLTRISHHRANRTHYVFEECHSPGGVTRATAAVGRIPSCGSSGEKSRLVLFSCALLLSATIFAAADNSLFRGIDDPKVLPLLTSGYGKSNRWNVPPQDGRFLYDLILARGYKRGLEIGTSNGYSGLWLGLALRKNGGKLITIEIDSERASEAQGNSKPGSTTSLSSGLPMPSRRFHN